MLEVHNQQKKIRVSLSKLIFFSERVISYLGLSKHDMTILLATDREVRRLNKQYLGHDWNTDVLSFPTQPAGRIKQGGKEKYLGDIVISPVQAKKQAKEFNTSLNYELCLYVVHGILHLLGYKDYPAKEKKKMEARQEKILLEIKRKWPLKKQKPLY